MAAGCNCKAAIGCVDARAPVRASYVSLYKWPESDAEFVKSVAMARRHQGGGGQESPGGASSYHYHYYYGSGSGSMRNSGELPAAAAGYCTGSPRVVDSYSCRQMYLRSYTFSKRKETVPERTMACLGRVRERGAAVFPLFLLPQRHGGGSSSSTDAASVGSVSSSRIAGAAVARGESRSRDDREDDGGVLGRLRGGGGSSVQQQQQARKQSRRRRRRKKKGCAVVRRLHEASCGAVRAIFRRLLACTTSVDVADGAGAPPQP